MMSMMLLVIDVLFLFSIKLSWVLNAGLVDLIHLRGGCINLDFHVVPQTRILLHNWVHLGLMKKIDSFISNY